MKKFLAKAKSTLQENSPQHNFQPQQSLPSTIAPPDPTEVLRYRYHHGTNLGSIFVLEQWLHGSMFPPNTGGSSECDAVYNSLHLNGLEATRQKWEQHWRSALTDGDLDWLAKEARCTSIRLPIGYFTLGPDFCHGTAFAGVKDVYVNAWAAVKDIARRARSYGIGILLDFHALPGGANKQDHSGTCSGKAELWGNRHNLDLATRCMVFAAQEIRAGNLEGIIGLQVVNEAIWDPKGLYDWYDEVIAAVSHIDDSIPIYISDGWDLNRALAWTSGRTVSRSARNPVVIDHHKYYTFSDEDRSQSPHQIIGRIYNELGQLDGKTGTVWDKGEVEIIIGEYSCVLDGKTWSQVPAEEKDGLTQHFGRAQSQKWQERTGGSYFWTYKMDWMDGGGWGFAEQTKKGNILPPATMRLSSGEIHQKMQVAQDRRQDLATGALRSHEEYWNRTAPGQRFQHELYWDGWNVGYSDAQAFFAMRNSGGLGHVASSCGGIDKIGCLEIWAKKRILESGQRGEFTWEWEQGLRGGISAFYQCVGI
ncbi:glycoside hydrolase-2 [Coleophoma crateriformis]|uniref:Glycoside hydrolase-2 n=1 Tax=Coleophoma crateriformis TaxID=565419 RepID=A0A3D8T7L2_9HELO|nr:glycoside hydrolase-2 [Coleophoma crateriformis]